MPPAGGRSCRRTTIGLLVLLAGLPVKRLLNWWPRDFWLGNRLWKSEANFKNHAKSIRDRG